MSNWRQHFSYRWPAFGIIELTIQTNAYHMVGEHWRQQLTGTNARKWGRIYIDPSVVQVALRRREALWETRGLNRGDPATNLDECPGAMFIPETNAISDVKPVDALSNQEFGRDLYLALRQAIQEAPGPKPVELTRTSMGWWQVVFRFT